MDTRASLLALLLFLSAVAVCESPFQDGAFHRDCLSSAHCLFSVSSDSQSSHLPYVPVSHCHTGASCPHHFTKLDAAGVLILPSVSILKMSIGYEAPENTLAKPIFNPPRPLL
ncbi:MAG: hypothetical protein ACT4NX_04745 [Deltaproteobacteria bacterium]